MFAWGLGQVTYDWSISLCLCRPSFHWSKLRHKHKHKKNLSVFLCLCLWLCRPSFHLLTHVLVLILMPMRKWKPGFRPSAFSGSPGVLLDLTWPAFCRTSWQRFFLDIQFRHPVCIWVNRCQYWKLLLVFFQWWRTANRKIQGRTLPRQNQQQNRKLFFIDQAAARSVAWLRWWKPDEQ